jgi:hypothetical protein
MRLDLIQNVHYEEMVLEAGKFVYVGGEPFGYCRSVVDGKAFILRRTHPDVDLDDLAHHGRHLERVRQLMFDKRRR